jgi:hypothetical protein
MRNGHYAPGVFIARNDDLRFRSIGEKQDAVKNNGKRHYHIVFGMDAKRLAHRSRLPGNEVIRFSIAP